MQADIGLFLLRVVAGVVFMYNGWPKLKNWKETFQWFTKERWPLPMLSTIIASIGETFGGLFLVIGLFVLPTSILLAIIMAGASIFELGKNGWSAAEKPLLLLAICIALFLTGGGAWQLV
jgi:putative oxidoreductase